jgi:rare lipoprotein A
LQPEDLILPSFGPIAPERPSIDEIGTQIALAAMSYAPLPKSSSEAFDAFDGAQAASLGSGLAEQVGEPFVAAGTYTDKSEAERVSAELAAFGRTVVETSVEEGEQLYSVNVYEDGRNSIDDLLQAAWQHGAPDAIAIRD